MDSPLLWVWVVIMISSLMMVVVAEGSMEFKVGGIQGWREPFENETAIYIQWASNNRFHVGDSLRFEYKKKKDSVIVVDKYCFYHCNCTSEGAVVVYEDGNTTLRLEKAGPAYFISGNTTHCKQGQRLLIHVLSPIYDSPPSSSSIAVPPDSSSYTAAAAPSPEQPSLATPPPSPLPPLALIIISSATVAVTAASYLFAAPT